MHLSDLGNNLIKYTGHMNVIDKDKKKNASATKAEDLSLVART